MNRENEKGVGQGRREGSGGGGSRFIRYFSFLLDGFVLHCSL